MKDKYFPVGCMVRHWLACVGAGLPVLGSLRFAVRYWLRVNYIIYKTGITAHDMRKIMQNTDNIKKP